MMRVMFEDGKPKERKLMKTLTREDNIFDTRSNESDLLLYSFTSKSFVASFLNDFSF